MNADLLDSPPTPARLAQLGRGGLLSPRARRRALSLTRATPSAAEWRGFLARGSLSLGSLLVASGVVFFFAYNWASLPAFGKFGLLEGAIAAACLLAGRQGLSSPGGQGALLFAALLVGPLLGVFGQTYQTGADPYQLFIGWAGLISMWVLVGRSPPLWLLWVLLLDVALGLYWTQVMHTSAETWERRGSPLAPLYFALQATAWVLWEAAARRGIAWVRGRWVPRLLCAATLGVVTVPSMLYVVEGRGDARSASGPVSLALLGLALGASLAFYRGKRLDLFPLAAGAGAVMLVCTAWAGGAIVDSHTGNVGALFVLGLFVLVQMATATAWLRRLGRGRA